MTAKSLSLQDGMAATLQARLSWPQAESCAADLAAMFGRAMQNCPLMCECCKNAPATHLLVADFRHCRVTTLVCGPCGECGIKDAAARTAAPAPTWLFALIPAGKADR